MFENNFIYINIAFNLQDLVQELYDFRDHYVARHGLEGAGKKEIEVEKKMQECLEKFEQCQGFGIFFVFSS